MYRASATKRQFRMFIPKLLIKCDFTIHSNYLEMVLFHTQMKLTPKYEVKIPLINKVSIYIIEKSCENNVNS